MIYSNAGQIMRHQKILVFPHDESVTYFLRNNKDSTPFILSQISYNL